MASSEVLLGGDVMKVLLSSFADLKMLKAVSLTCHSLSSLARAVIEDQHVFTITNIHQSSIMMWYNTKKIKKVYWKPSMCRHPDILISFFPLLSHLFLWDQYDDPLATLPSSLSHLSLNNTFVKPLPQQLPLSLTHLSLSSYFNHPLPSLPPNIQYLKTGACFNRPLSLSNYFHLSILDIGYSFNSSLSLPPHLKRLFLGHTFNQKINNSPDSITHLYFGNDCIFPSLPPHLQYLMFFPQSKFNAIIDYPSFLTHLSFNNRFDSPINNLPPNLTHLTVGDRFNLPLFHLPSSLTHLCLGRSFSQSINSLPSTITHLSLTVNVGDNNTILPKSLQYIIIGCFVPGRQLKFQIPNNIHSFLSSSNPTRFWEMEVYVMK